MEQSLDDLDTAREFSRNISGLYVFCFRQNILFIFENLIAGCFNTESIFFYIQAHKGIWNISLLFKEILAHN